MREEQLFRIAVCDSVSQDRCDISHMTENILKKERIHFRLTLYDNGISLLKDIRQGVCFHLLLLEVALEGMSGMELAAALRRQQDDTAIVFISHDRDMALRGYEVSAVRYLAKPAGYGFLREALLFCAGNFLEKKKLLLPTVKGKRGILFSELVYAEARGRGVRLFLTKGFEDAAVKISELEQTLPGWQFVLCHRAFLVNLGFVRYLRRCELELQSGGVLPVSKYRFSEVCQKLQNYV